MLDRILDKVTQSNVFMAEITIIGIFFASFFAALAGLNFC